MSLRASVNLDPVSHNHGNYISCHCYVGCILKVSNKKEKKKEEKKEKLSPSYFGNKPKEGKIISEYMKRPEE